MSFGSDGALTAAQTGELVRGLQLCQRRSQPGEELLLRVERQRRRADLSPRGFRGGAVLLANQHLLRSVWPSSSSIAAYGTGSPCWIHFPALVNGKLTGMLDCYNGGNFPC